MTDNKPSVEYKVVRAEADDVVGTIAEHAIEGWEPVSIYPRAIKGEGTMHLLVTSVSILLRRTAG